MSQNDNIFNGRLVKRGDKLVYENPGDAEVYKEFVKNLEEGQHVDAFFDANKDNGTHAQLAKIHVCIRKLAQELGYSFEDLKLEIKKKAGLVTGEHVKSFGKCSIDELGLVIEALNEVGVMVNISF